MKNSKLASLLSSLSQKEFKDYGKFIRCSYFNSNSNIIKLYDIIAKHFPDFDNPNLRKETIYNSIYPGEEYKDNKARGLISAALKTAEDFLAVNHIKNNDYHYKDFLLTELCERKVFDLFNIHLKENRTELAEVITKDEDYFYFKYRIETLLNSIESKNYIPLTQKDIPGDVQTNDTDNLLNYFFITVLKRYTYLLTKTDTLNVSVELNFFDEILSYLSKIDLSDIPLLNFHFNRAMFHKSKMDEKYFFVLRKIFFEDLDRLDKSDNYNLLASLQNYCSRNLKITGENIAEAKYDIYEFAMQKNILTFDENEPMNPVLFSNIVGAALNIGKIDSAKNFIDNYKHRLAPERMNSAVNINMAKIFFKEKNYNSALSSLALVQNEDVFYKVAIKNLHAAIYYDTGSTEELILLLETYRSFLNSNVVLGQFMKDNHLGFISFLTKLIKLRDIKNKTEIEYLKHELDNTPTVMSKEWLLEKVDELLK